MKKIQNNIFYFYQGDKLGSIKRGEFSQTILRNGNMPLAEHNEDKDIHSDRFYSIDIQGSVLGINDKSGLSKNIYSAYGHEPAQTLNSLLGFNGQYRTPTGCYLLGNGYRAYNPIFMRFQSPDTLSPFSLGGINAYTYCLGDPINRSDPNGHWSILKPRTWLRKNSTKVAQRQKALDAIIPKLNQSNLSLENALTSRRYQGKLATSVIRRSAKENKPLQARALRKIRGIAKHENYNDQHALDAVSKSIVLIKQTSYADLQYQRMIAELIANQPNLFSVGVKRRDNPYDDIKNIRGA